VLGFKKLGLLDIFIDAEQGAPTICPWARRFTDPVAVIFWAIAAKLFWTWSFFGLTHIWSNIQSTEQQITW